MVNYFLKNKQSSKKSQVSMFFLALIVTLIVVTFVTVNIGKIAKDKTYTANSADSGAISGASVLAYAFNYVAESNKDKVKGFERNYKDFRQAISGGETAVNGRRKFGPHFPHAYMQYDSGRFGASVSNKDYGVDAFRSLQVGGAAGGTDYLLHSDKAKKDSCCPLGSAAGEAGLSITKGIDPFIATITNLRDNVIPTYANTQQIFIQEVRERVHDDGKGRPNDLYNIALSTAAKFNFENSGTSPRLGKMNQKRYSQFLQGLSPGSVKSGEPKTFMWVDGAGRAHMVTAIITINDVHSYEMIVMEGKLKQVKGELSSAITNAGLAKASVTLAKASYVTGATLCKLSLPGCSIAEGIGDGLMLAADGAMHIAYLAALDAEKHLIKSKKSVTRNSKLATKSADDIIAYIKDINHDRTVSSYQFQFHMGSPVKGMRGDVDVMTFYPPVQSSATASFRGKGTIYPQKPEHDVSLIKVE